MSDLQSIAQHAIETAKKYGAQNASADISRRQSREISWRKGRIEDIDSAGTYTLFIKLYVDGRYGIFKTSDVNHDSIDNYLRNAIDMTRLLEEDPARGLPDPSLYENRADIDLELYDPAVAQLTPNDLIEKCGSLEAECQKVQDLDIFDVTVSYGMKQYEAYLVNTNGFEGVRKQSSAFGKCAIKVSHGEKISKGVAWHTSRFWSELHNPYQIASEAVQNCRYRIGAKKISSKVRTILLDHVKDSFLYRYLNPLDGYALIRKRSYFSEKLGKMVGSPLLDIQDRPFIKRAIGSRLFDDNGISAREATIIDHGVLQSFYIDPYCANKLKMKATISDSSNIVLTPGKRSRDEMIADIKDGIYVIDLIGGNSDPVQGDFSHGIIGVAIENGKLTQNVSEMNISGNHLELWNNLTEVGNDPRDDSDYFMPTLRFDNVSTSGS